MIWVVLTLGLVALLVLWDAARRYIDAMRFNQAALEQVKQLGEENGRTREQVQALLQKLNAAQASQATRMPPRIGRG